MYKIYRKIAKIVPKKLRYFILIDSWAKATGSKWGHLPATGIKIEELLDRLDLMKP